MLNRAQTQESIGADEAVLIPSDSGIAGYDDTAGLAFHDLGCTLTQNAAHECATSVKDASNHHHIFANFYLVVSDASEEVADPRFQTFCIENVISYTSFCDDFGPMNLGAVFQFCIMVDNQLAQFKQDNVALKSSSDRRALTNAVFLVGAYMIIKLRMAPRDVESRFQGLIKSLAAFRDVSPGEQNFHLTVMDCWAGLWRAKSLDWVDFGPDGFDLDEYMHLDDALNADLHEIVPGKFVAMQGPKDLPRGVSFLDVLTPSQTFSHREFSPAHYIDILQQFDVKVVVRLNAPAYDKQSFVDGGIAVADLFFEDCSVPNIKVVAKFLKIAEAVPGAVAVHCKAGLGRTGTLIALYMMKHYGFTAREAMGWIRIVRPGSIIGRQQQFLCGQEALMHRAGEQARRRGLTSVLEETDVGAIQRFVGHVDKEVDDRLNALLELTAAASLQPAGRPPLQRNRSEQDLAAHVSAASERRGGRRAMAAVAQRTGSAR